VFAVLALVAVVIVVSLGKLPGQLAAFVKDQLVLWEKLITNAGIEKQ